MKPQRLALGRILLLLIAVFMETVTVVVHSEHARRLLETLEKLGILTIVRPSSAPSSEASPEQQD